jgi:LacI family transcriptional regulator
MWQVALIYDATHTYDLKVMTGVAAYFRENGKYNVYIESNALKDQRLPSLRSWGGDGVIANFDHPAVARAVAQSRLPAVAFGSGYGWYRSGSRIPYFSTNHVLVSSLAADHFLDRGFRHFGYCGYVRTETNGWTEDRRREYVRHLRKRGFDCHVYHAHHKTTQRWTSLQNSLAKWLVDLPKPVGIMAANDDRAHHVLEACRKYGLDVPHEVAVIGVNNDELLCNLTSPTLSSIEQSARRMGYEAAVCLERLICGQMVQKKHFIFDPLGIVIRQSTDVTAVDDPSVVKALRFIQEHSSEGIKVPDVVAAAMISRSGLEMRFTKQLGYTIRSAIRNGQLERVRRLISESNLPLKQVAMSTGFKSIQHMTRLFTKAFHIPPAKYRKGLV